MQEEGGKGGTKSDEKRDESVVGRRRMEDREERRGERGWMWELMMSTAGWASLLENSKGPLKDRHTAAVSPQQGPAWRWRGRARERESAKLALT